MQRSGGRNTQPERRRNKLKRYESRQKELYPGMQNWGNTQGERQQQPGQIDVEPEGQDHILPIPANVPHEGFDIETPLEEISKESSRYDQWA